MVSFRYLDERHIPTEIKLMKWNPKMDLIALALTSGDIILHRLVTWQKVWHIPAPKVKNTANDGKNTEKTNVIDIDWRTDGRILAIAYCDDITDGGNDMTRESRVVLHDVESSELIHVIPVNGKVNCIRWEEKKIVSHDDAEDILSTIGKSALPAFSNLIPKAKSFSDKSFTRGFGSRKVTDENINDLMRVENQETLNILAIGNDNGIIELYALAVFKIAKINVGPNVSIHYIALSNDLGMINVLVKEPIKSENDKINYSLMNYNIEILKNRNFEILLIAQIYAQSISLLYYLNETIREILEAWEDVLVEIDSKLSNYVSQQYKSQKKSDDLKESKISLMADEFLELLVLGNASDSLEKFLTDLTDKGLKKLGHSIELAYSNIQKLVLKNIQRVCQLLYCHFNSLKGMSLWDSQFGDVGLDPCSVNKALKSIGSFLLKSTELQQVIDNSMRNVKSFIRWLYTAMSRLYNNEPSTQSELTKVSQQDIQFVAEFIKENFDSEHSSFSTSPRPSESNFTLESVGQYLRDKNLICINTSINDMSINPWIKYIRERPKLISPDDDDLLYLYPHNPESSLIQEHKNCDNCIRDAFTKPYSVISSSIEKCGIICKLPNIISVSSEESVKIHHTTNISTGHVYNAFIKERNSMNRLCIIRHSLNQSHMIEISTISFYETKSNVNPIESIALEILDLQFYTDEIISLLLIDPDTSLSFLVQLPLRTVNKYRQLTDDISLSSLVDDDDDVILHLGSDPIINYRSLENMKSSFLAVSGSRKVSCVAFSSKRRVRLFEMDVSEEEEDETLEISTEHEPEHSEMESECALSQSS